MSSPPKLTFLIIPVGVTSLCMVMQAEWVESATTALEEQTSDRSKTEKALQSADCLPLAQ